MKTITMLVEIQQFCVRLVFNLQAYTQIYFVLKGTNGLGQIFVLIH